MQTRTMTPITVPTAIPATAPLLSLEELALASGVDVDGEAVVDHVDGEAVVDVGDGGVHVVSVLVGLMTMVPLSPVRAGSKQSVKVAVWLNSHCPHVSLQFHQIV